MELKLSQEQRRQTLDEVNQLQAKLKEKNTTLAQDSHKLLKSEVRSVYFLVVYEIFIEGFKLLQWLAILRDII